MTTIIDCANTKEAIETQVTTRFPQVGCIVFIPSSHPLDNLSTLPLTDVVTTSGRGAADEPYKTVFVQWPFVLGYTTGTPVQPRKADLLAFDERPVKRQKCKASNPQTESMTSMAYLYECFACKPEAYGDYFTDPFEHGTKALQIPMIGPEKMKLAMQLYHLWFKKDKTARLNGELAVLELDAIGTDELEKLTSTVYALWQRLTKEAIKRNI